MSQPEVLLTLSHEASHEFADAIEQAIDDIDLGQHIGISANVMEYGGDSIITADYDEVDANAIAVEPIAQAEIFVEVGSESQLDLLDTSDAAEFEQVLKMAIMTALPDDVPFNESDMLATVEQAFICEHPSEQVDESPAEGPGFCHVCNGPAV